MFQRVQTQIENNSLIDDIFEQMQIGVYYYNFILIRKSNSLTIYKCIRNSSEQDYIVYRLPYQKMQKAQSLQLNIPYPIEKLNQIRLANIIHPEDIYFEQNCVYMTQQTYLNNFQLLNCKKSLSQKDQLLLVTQISITLQEFKQRNFPPYLLSLTTIYIIENVVHFSFLHFKFEEVVQDDFESFKQFVNQYFHIAYQYCINDYENTTENLLKIQNLDYLDQGCPHLNYVKLLFEITNLRPETRGSNSYTFSSKKPSLFQIYPFTKQEIFIKAPRIVDDEGSDVYEYRQLQNDRELMFNEQLYNNSKFATFFAYLRIQKHLFFIYPKYPQSLQQLFEDSSQTIALQKLQYKFALQLAQALTELHKMQILHRDIKPQNVFLTSSDINQANIKLADFDRSRKLYLEGIDKQNDFEKEDSSGQNTIFSSTYEYNPPEAFGDQYDFSSDIWQFGLTLFQMANKGIYPPVKSTMLFHTEDYQNINLNLISSVLKDKQVYKDYIELISRCLEFKSDQRITLSEFIKSLRKIIIDVNNQDEVIESDYCNNSDQSTGSFDQTICWRKFSQPKSPDWNLMELAQLSGDTLNFLKDQ